MESDSLPYSLFLILAELSLGMQIVIAAADLRGQVTRGFLRATTIMIPFGLALATWVAFTLEGQVVEGYRLDTGPVDAIRGGMVALTVGSVLHNWAIYTERVRLGRWLGGVLGGLALVVLGLLGVMLRLPAASGVLVAASLIVGALVVGAAVVGLALGHSYLVTPRQPARPLNEVTTVLLVLLGVQVALFGLALALPVDATPRGGRDQAVGASSVAFWLRVVVGLVLPIVFAWMALLSSRVRSMMAATGLLYLVTGAVLAGEIVARALLLDSARPL